MRVYLKSVLVTGLFAACVSTLVFTSHPSARAPQQATAPADFVLTNGKVVTVEEGAPEAQAVAASGGKIIAIGSSADIKKFIGPKTEVVDAKGQLVIPTSRGSAPHG
jgi:adenine deaminase